MVMRPIEPSTSSEPPRHRPWILPEPAAAAPIAYLNLRTAARGWHPGLRCSIPMALAGDDKGCHRRRALAHRSSAANGCPTRALRPKPLLAMQAYLRCSSAPVMSAEVGRHQRSAAARGRRGDWPAGGRRHSMGRAFPEGQMTSFAVAGLPMLPLVLSDIRDNDVIIPRAASPRWMERIARKTLTEIGAVAATCKGRDRP